MAENQKPSEHGGTLAYLASLHESAATVKIGSRPNPEANKRYTPAPQIGFETMSDDPSSPASVDARGEICPMPLLMAKRALRDVPSGVFWSCYRRMRALSGISRVSRDWPDTPCVASAMGTNCN